MGHSPYLRSRDSVGGIVGHDADIVKHKRCWYEKLCAPQWLGRPSQPAGRRCGRADRPPGGEEARRTRDREIRALLEAALKRLEETR